MQLVEGESLDLALEAPAESDCCLPLLYDLLDVLAHAHERGIVHHDLKPQNLIVNRCKDLNGQTIERLHVIDFGLAAVRALDVFGARLPAGTLRYMAPEQRDGSERPDGRADLYAVGVIAKQLFGRNLAPFDRFTAEDREQRPRDATEAIAELVAHHGEGPARIATPSESKDPSQALRFALGSSRVPDALLRSIPREDRAGFLSEELVSGRLARRNGRWVYDPVNRDVDDEVAASPHPHSAHQRIAAGVEFEEASNLDAAARVFADASRIARSQDDPAGEGEALHKQARIAYKRGELSEALSLAQEALACARAGGAWKIVGACLGNLGLLHDKQLHLDEAIEYHEEALDVFEHTDSPAELWAIQCNLGSVHVRRLDLAQARVCYERALAVAKDASEPVWEAGVLINLSNLSLLVRDFTEAARFADEAVSRVDPDGPSTHLALALRNRATALARLDPENPRIEPELIRAHRLAEDSGNREVVVELELDLASREAERGQLRVAAARTAAARDEAAEKGYTEHLIRAHVVLADIFNRGAMCEKALREAQEAERSAVAASTALHQIDAMEQSVVALEKLGRVEEARAVEAKCRSALSALQSADR